MKNYSIKCFIGIHSWAYSKLETNKPERKCQRAGCTKKQIGVSSYDSDSNRQINFLNPRPSCQ